MHAHSAAAGRPPKQPRPATDDQAGSAPRRKRPPKQKRTARQTHLFSPGDPSLEQKSVASILKGSPREDHESPTPTVNGTPDGRQCDQLDQCDPRDNGAEHSFELHGNLARRLEETGEVYSGECKVSAKDFTKECLLNGTQGNEDHFETVDRDGSEDDATYCLDYSSSECLSSATRRSEASRGIHRIYDGTEPVCGPSTFQQSMEKRSFREPQFLQVSPNAHCIDELSCEQRTSTLCDLRSSEQSAQGLWSNTTLTTGMGDGKPGGPGVQLHADPTTNGTHANIRCVPGHSPIHNTTSESAGINTTADNERTTAVASLPGTPRTSFTGSTIPTVLQQQHQSLKPIFDIVHSPFPPEEPLPLDFLAVMPASSGSPGAIVFFENGQRQVVKLAQITNCTLPLAPLSPPTLNLHCVQHWMEQHDEDTSLIKWLTTDELSEHLEAGVFPSQRRCSVSRRFSATDVHISLDGPLELQEEECIFSLPFFKVPKSCGTRSRLIQDCREFNSYFNTFPNLVSSVNSVRLPLVDDVVENVLQHANKILDNDPVLLQFDAKAYFFQLIMPRRLRRFFGGRMSSCRGAFLKLWSRALPMGSTFSPAVAQQVARGILEEVKRRIADESVLADVYIDNFFFVAPAALSDRVKEAFTQVASEIDLKFEEEPPNAPLLGFEFCFSSAVMASVVLKPRLIKTNRDALAVFGAAMWANVLGKVPLALYEDALDVVRDICSHKFWDGLFGGDPAPLNRLWHDANHWTRSARPSAVPSTILWSDATPTCIAAMLDDETWRMITKLDSPIPIHVAEMAAATMALIQFTDSHAAIIVDNTIVANALHRGHSSSREINTMLRLLYHHRNAATFTAWVPTHLQRADPLTRGKLCGLPPIVQLPAFRRTRWTPKSE